MKMRHRDLRNRVSFRSPELGRGTERRVSLIDKAPTPKFEASRKRLPDDPCHGKGRER
jgi:hypothetical protein